MTYIPQLRTRLLSRTHRVENCLVWQGYINPAGYGEVYVRRHEGGIGRKGQLAHIVSYRLYKGDIPAGLELDHLCRNRACINPDHLEAVTHQINMHRGTAPAAINKAKTHCKHGHVFTDKQPAYYILRGWRRCNECHKRIQADRRSNIRQREASAGVLL